MREIKFRGKRKDTDEWIYGDLLPNHTGEPVIIPIGEVLGHYVIPETVGQFTGVYDKFGKEIYEGDSLDYYSMPILFKVVFNDGVFEATDGYNTGILRSICRDCIVFNS